MRPGKLAVATLHCFHEVQKTIDVLKGEENDRSGCKIVITLMDVWGCLVTHALEGSGWFWAWKATITHPSPKRTSPPPTKTGSWQFFFDWAKLNFNRCKTLLSQLQKQKIPLHQELLAQRQDWTLHLCSVCVLGSLVTNLRLWVLLLQGSHQSGKSEKNRELVPVREIREKQGIFSLNQGEKFKSGKKIKSGKNRGFLASIGQNVQFDIWLPRPSDSLRGCQDHMKGWHINVVWHVSGNRSSRSLASKQLSKPKREFLGFWSWRVEKDEDKRWRFLWGFKYTTYIPALVLRAAKLCSYQWVGLPLPRLALHTSPMELPKQKSVNLFDKKSIRYEFQQLCLDFALWSFRNLVSRCNGSVFTSFTLCLLKYFHPD